MRRRPPAPTALVLALALAGGCGGGERYDRDVKVPLEEVPAAALKVARERLPDVDFAEAWKVPDEGEPTFEVRGQADDGKTRDIKVTASGKVLEVD